MLYLQEQSKKWIADKPQIWEEEILSEKDMRAIWYSGLDGKRNFAFIGLPEGASKRHKVPGLVLIHGGGGTAFPNWIRYWNKRGYAAIAMDTCGAFFDPRNQYNNWPRHSFSGPAGWGAYHDAALPPGSQWYAHAIASVLKATTILADLPEIDSGRIGMTGISWGAVLAIIAAGLDPRIKASSMIYGCGFFNEDDAYPEWRNAIRKMTKTQQKWYVTQWDAKNFAPLIRHPTQWIASTNDFAFYPNYWQQTIDLVPAPVRQSMKIRWPHGHGKPGEQIAETAAFFDEILAGGKPMHTLTAPMIRNGRMSAKTDADGILCAELLFTADGNGVPWDQRDWLPVSAEIRNGTVSAPLPDGWQAAFLSVVSSDRLFTTSRIRFKMA